MSRGDSLIIELPEDMAVEAIRSGLANRVLRRRGLSEAAVLVLGVGGSLVSILQSPTTLRDLSAWLTIRATARQERTLVRLAKGGDGRTILEVAPGQDVEIVTQLLENALRTDT